jgi:two-component system phosphate regulon response regulator PhoB
MSATGWVPVERVLIVDDDPDIRRLVGHHLTQAGFDVVAAENGREGLEMAFSRSPSLVVLDLMLPDLDGNEVCRTLREQLSEYIPILMLSARGEEIDRVLGFELGADDYVIKPFSPRELVLRVRSLLRRVGAPQGDVISIGSVLLDPGKRQCIVTGTGVTLTAKEFDLVYELMRARGNVLTRSYLMDHIWGYHGDSDSRTLDTHVRRLREKLGSEGERIQTVRGVGYRYDVGERSDGG